MSRWCGRSGPLSLLIASLLLCALIVCRPATGLEMTPELLFTQLEERSERVDSLEAEVELSSGVLRTTVNMAIQSPDKFSMDFAGGAMRVVFDGEKFWVYVAALAEVFTLESSGNSGWVSDSLREWVNPRKIITHLTKETIFTLFKISMLPPEPETEGLPVASGSEPMKNASEAVSATPTYRLRFAPSTESWVTKLFDVGSYEMTFSGEHFLPQRVVELSPEGKPRGRLRVLAYRLNQPFPKERFIYIKPEGVKEVPISDVLSQKAEQSKDLLIESVGRFLQRIQQRISDWGK